MNRYPLLTYINLFSPILPLGIGILKFSTLHRVLKILFFYLIFAFTADIFFLWFVKGYYTVLGLYHVYYLIEYIFIMSIIYGWQETHRMERFIQTLMLLYIVFWVIAKCTFEPLSGLYSIIACTSQILLVIGAETTLIVVVGNRTQPILSQFRFWVLLSFIIYYTGTLLIIAARGILLHYPVDILLFVSSIDWSLKILFNILFAIGFLCPQTQT